MINGAGLYFKKKYEINHIFHCFYNTWRFGVREERRKMDNSDNRLFLGK